MRRRNFLAVLAGAAAYPFSAGAQQKTMPVIGFLGSDSPGPAASYLPAFRQGLSETGYVEGQNVAIKYRWAEGHYDRSPALGADLVGQGVDVIVTSGTPPSLAAKTATSTIPIVFNVGDPIGIGLVDSLARPGGNLTGVSLMSNETANQEKPDPYSLVNKVINDTDAFYAELQKLNTYDGIYSYAPELLEDMLSGAKENIHTLEHTIVLLDEALSFIRQRKEPR